jgi:hypothetical protein
MCCVSYVDSEPAFAFFSDAQLVVFTDIMTVANNGGPGSDTRGNPAQHEAALKVRPPPNQHRLRVRMMLTQQTWARSLPRHLSFDENTLNSSVNKLSSPLHTTSRSAWLFAYMHALAECGMFYLQATLATNGADWAAQRQSQAVDNIAVILEAVGVRGRESPLSESAGVRDMAKHRLTFSDLPTARRQQLARPSPIQSGPAYSSTNAP